MPGVLVPGCGVGQLRAFRFRPVTANKQKTRRGGFNACFFFFFFAALLLCRFLSATASGQS